MLKRSRTKQVESAVKHAASKSDIDFVTDYLDRNSGGDRNSWAETWKHPSTGTVYTLSLSQPRHTSESDLEACFALVEETSRHDYESSSRGWNPKGKRKEMREPDLRYILVKNPDGTVCAYTSLMPTMEEGEAVVYCYEIHLKPDLRGTGLADLLMGFLDTAARNIEVIDKVMLTVFKCNTRATRFYRRFGFAMDDISPRPRKLRNGVVKEPDYEILSKRVEHGRRDSGSVRSSGANGEGTTSRPTKMAKVEQYTADVDGVGTEKE